MDIKKRSEVAIEDTWDLTPLFADEAAWEEGMKALQQEIDKAPSFKGKLGEGKESFLATFAWYEKTGILAERLYSWAFLQYAGDASDSNNVKRYSLISQSLAQLGANMAYFDPELLAIGEETVQAYLQDPSFAPYKVYLEKSRRFKEHVLSEKEERIMALQSEVSSTARTTFGDLTNVDFDFGSIDGKSLTQSTFSSFLMSEDRELRKKAYKQFYAVYDQHKHTIARLYEGQVKQDKFSCKAR